MHKKHSFIKSQGEGGRYVEQCLMQITKVNTKQKKSTKALVSSRNRRIKCV